MNTVVIRGVQFKIGFHFANGSFDKVINATNLFEQNKMFVLLTNNEDDFLIYLPKYLSTVDNNGTTEYANIEQLQMQLGIHLMCFDKVLPLEEVDVLTDSLKLIE